MKLARLVPVPAVLLALLRGRRRARWGTIAAAMATKRTPTKAAPAAKPARTPAARAGKTAAAQPKSAAKAKPAAAPARAAKSAAGAKGDPQGWTLERTMKALEAAGTEQTRKTYARHGAEGPMFGVSFAALKELVKKIGVDHDLAVELWKTGNHDARILAAKIADPARATAAQLDRWAKEVRVRSCGGYVAMLAAEGPHGISRAEAWLGSSDERLRCSGWTLAGHLALVDETTPDAWFEPLLARIAKSIHDAPNDERNVMNTAVIQIGGRNGALRKVAAAAAQRIGKVDVDHGDTSCKTQDAADYLAKTWAHAKSKGFDSPAAQERARQTMRTRC